MLGYSCRRSGLPQMRLLADLIQVSLTPNTFLYPPMLAWFKIVENQLKQCYQNLNFQQVGGWVKGCKDERMWCKHTFMHHRFNLHDTCRQIVRQIASLCWFCSKGSGSFYTKNVSVKIFVYKELDSLNHLNIGKSLEWQFTYWLYQLVLITDIKKITSFKIFKNHFKKYFSNQRRIYQLYTHLLIIVICIVATRLIN